MSASARSNDLFNTFFLKGKGIHHEVMKEEILGMLGPGASFEPGNYYVNTCFQ